MRPVCELNSRAGACNQAHHSQPAAGRHAGWTTSNRALERAAGNALCLEQITKVMLDAAASGPAADAVPASVQDGLLARVGGQMRGPGDRATGRCAGLAVQRRTAAGRVGADRADARRRAVLSDVVGFNDP